MRLYARQKYKKPPPQMFHENVLSMDNNKRIFLSIFLGVGGGAFVLDRSWMGAYNGGCVFLGQKRRIHRSKQVNRCKTTGADDAMDGKSNLDHLGFEAELFKAADKLRGNMEPSDLS